MTTNELQIKYAKLIKKDCLSGDKEADHKKRDEYLTSFLMDAGFDELADASDEADGVDGFWYA